MAYGIFTKTLELGRKIREKKKRRRKEIYDNEIKFLSHIIPIQSIKTLFLFLLVFFSCW